MGNGEGKWNVGPHFKRVGVLKVRNLNATLQGTRETSRVVRTVFDPPFGGSSEKANQDNPRYGEIDFQKKAKKLK